MSQWNELTVSRIFKSIIRYRGGLVADEIPAPIEKARMIY